MIDIPYSHVLVYPLNNKEVFFDIYETEKEIRHKIRALNKEKAQANAKKQKPTQSPIP